MASSTDFGRRHIHFRRAAVLIIICVYGLYRLYSEPVSSGSGKRSATASAPATRKLWPDVPRLDQSKQDPSQSTWEHIRENNDQGTLRKQRASWGALNRQGARSHLQDALRGDRKYVYTEAGWGWNNQVVELMNLIYLGRLTNRIPILFAFNVVTGFHKGNQTTFRIPVSDVFDLSTLAGIVETPIIETHEVKRVAGFPKWLQPSVYDGEFRQMNKTSNRRMRLGELIEPEETADDHLGCHSFTMTAKRDAAGFFTMEGFHGHRLALPPSICHRGNCEQPSMLQLADILVNDDSQELLAEHLAMGFEEPPVLPHPQIACIDLLFHFMTHPSRFNVITEEIEEGYGAWAIVGRHMRFQPGLVQLAQQYIRYNLDLQDEAPIPPYLSVHIRRGDMVKFRPDWFAKSATEWMYAAWLLLDEIRRYKGILIQEVILTTDEDDPTWLAPIVDAGWTFLNHTATDTSRRLGSEWFPMLLDAVILSGGHGFLGMPDSTMGAFAHRRVVDWQAGIGRFAESHIEVPEEWEWEWPSL